MMAALYAECRKLTSVRSTWILSGIGLLFAGFLAFWAHGYKGGPVYSPQALQTAVMEDLAVVSIFTGIVAILLICHEYRYNTVSYTLTAANSRLKVLLAKFMVIGGYSIAITVFSYFWIMGLMTLGAHIAGNSLGSQTIEVYDLVWRTLFFMVTTGWLGLVLGFLSRSVVFAIVAYFVLPVLEQMAHFLLKVSNNYLPTTVQGQVMGMGAAEPGAFSAAASAGMFSLYLFAAIIVATVLFIRRDAN